MKLITELVQEPLALLTESTKDGKNTLFIEGIFAQSEKKNRNGRSYPKSVLESAVTKYMEKVQNKTALGELNHPPRLNVDPREACHLITELRWVGNDVIGKAKVLTSTPVGKIVEGLLNDGVRLGVSTRGAGSLKESNGINVVGSDFFLTAIDTVSDPSCPTAWINGILEGVEYFVDNKGAYIQETFETKVKAAYDAKKLDESMKLKLFSEFMLEITRNVR